MEDMPEEDLNVAELDDATPRPATDSQTEEERILGARHSWRFQASMSPVLLQYIARMKGLEPAPIGEPFAYCQLGSGNGVTANILAAALPQGRFFGVDPNGESIATARRLAEAGGLDNVEHLACGYGDLGAQELPDFDYITLHGVYSGIGREARQAIVRFIDEKLKPGGLVYLAYNALPGWAPMLPLRDIMLSYTSLREQGRFERAAQGLRYLRFLRDNRAAFFQLNPGSERFLDGILKQDPAYVADEYFGRNWQPLYFSQAAVEMANAGLSYCGSAQIERNYTDLMVPKQFWEFLDTADSDIVRETHKSLILNESFRRDVYGKATEAKPAEARADVFGEVVFGTSSLTPAVAKERKVGQVSVRLADELYDAMLPAMAGGEHSFDELMALPEMAGVEPRAALMGLHRLIATGQARPFAAKAVAVAAPAERIRIASAFNRALLEERILKDSVCSLASPVLGNGVALDLVQGLLLLGHDAAGPEGAVDNVMDRLRESGASWHMQGQTVDDESQMRAILEEKTADFRQTSAPLLQRLGVIEAA